MQLLFKSKKGNCGHFEPFFTNLYLELKLKSSVPCIPHVLLFQDFFRFFLS